MGMVEQAALERRCESRWSEFLQRQGLTPALVEELAKHSIIFRPCATCGHGVGGKGGQAYYVRYCSNACRQKAYRLRHGQRYDRPGRPPKADKTLRFQA